MRYIVRRNAYSLGLSLIAAREPVHLSQVRKVLAASVH